MDLKREITFDNYLNDNESLKIKISDKILLIDKR